MAHESAQRRATQETRYEQAARHGDAVREAGAQKVGHVERRDGQTGKRLHVLVEDARLPKVEELLDGRVGIGEEKRSHFVVRIRGAPEGHEVLDQILLELGPGHLHQGLGRATAPAGGVLGNAMLRTRARTTNRARRTSRCYTRHTRQRPRAPASPGTPRAACATASGACSGG